MRALCRGAAVLAIPLVCTGCFFGTSKKSFDYGPYVASNPRSVVVAPITGAGPQAQDALRAYVTKPLAERGYYVMPVAMTWDLAEQQGFSAVRRETTTWLDIDNNYSGAKVVDKTTRRWSSGCNVIRKRPSNAVRVADQPSLPTPPATGTAITTTSS
jgi:hypothetical protein